jgi:hypothetical protein
LGSFGPIALGLPTALTVGMAKVKLPSKDVFDLLVLVLFVV